MAFHFNAHFIIEWIWTLITKHYNMYIPKHYNTIICLLFYNKTSCHVRSFQSEIYYWYGGETYD